MDVVVEASVNVTFRRCVPAADKTLLSAFRFANSLWTRKELPIRFVPRIFNLTAFCSVVMSDSRADVS